jgi:3-hydroxyisobutyrate dehydrogenase-like beta-hydroxyacid dehydrogenase
VVSTGAGRTVLPRAAVLGTGTMGSAMALNLLRAGLVVDVWDRTPAAAARLAAAGAAAHSRPGQAVAHADVVITMLADEAAVLSVAIDQDMLDMLQQGAVWAQMATIGVQATERLARIVADTRPDVRFVDAPVSGTRQPAETGAEHLAGVLHGRHGRIGGPGRPAAGGTSWSTRGSGRRTWLPCGTGWTRAP